MLFDKRGKLIYLYIEALTEFECVYPTRISRDNYIFMLTMVDLNVIVNLAKFDVLGFTEKLIIKKRVETNSKYEVCKKEGRLIIQKT